MDHKKFYNKNFSTVDVVTYSFLSCFFTWSMTEKRKGRQNLKLELIFDLLIQATFLNFETKHAH